MEMPKAFRIISQKDESRLNVEPIFEDVVPVSLFDRACSIASLYYDQERDLFVEVPATYDTEELHENVTVQIWTDSKTGKQSIGWY